MRRPGTAEVRARADITLLVNDLAGNAIVRAAPLAEALARDFRVQLVGLLLSGDEVYAPYRERFEVSALRCAPRLGAMLAAAPRLARLARGDLLYACKPLLTTLLPALLAGRGRRPVLLDVEDDERAAPAPDAGRRPGARRWVDPHRLHARLAHPLRHAVAGVTVASEALRARYGGTLLRHGPDETRFDPTLPALADRRALRAALGLPQGAHLALFAGVPRPHKGWDTLLAALSLPAAAGWQLVAAGPRGPAHQAAAARLGTRFHHLGEVDNFAMPALLAAVDAVPVPQHDTRYGCAQLPAKLVEAMAMARPVVASAVGDLPEILGGGARGWLVPPADPERLAQALADVAADGAAAARRGQLARSWFEAEASVGTLQRRLTPLVESLLAGRSPRTLATVAG